MPLRDYRSFTVYWCTLHVLVYQIGRSASKLLSSLSLGPERKVKCYNRYFVNLYVFHTEEYGQERKTYNCGVCVKGSTSSELEVDYYGRLEEVIELQYHSEQNSIFIPMLLVWHNWQRNQSWSVLWSGRNQLKI